VQRLAEQPAQPQPTSHMGGLSQLMQVGTFALSGLSKDVCRPCGDIVALNQGEVWKSAVLKEKNKVLSDKVALQGQSLDTRHHSAPAYAPHDSVAGPHHSPSLGYRHHSSDYTQGKTPQSTTPTVTSIQVERSMSCTEGRKSAPGLVAMC
jgi:hypothetical protein